MNGLTLFSLKIKLELLFLTHSLYLSGGYAIGKVLFMSKALNWVIFQKVGEECGHKRDQRYKLD